MPSSVSAEFQPPALRGMATDAGSKRCSPPSFLRNPTADNCYMHDSQLSNSCKRRRAEPHALRSDGALQHQSKKQKFNHLTIESPPTSAYWDNLSKIWLTKGALRELCRRTSQPVSSPQSRRSHRPITRNFLAELRSGQDIQSASDILRHCEPEVTKDIKRFARNGGPNLSDLKGFPEPSDPLNHIMSSNQSGSRRRKRSQTSSQEIRPTTNTINTKTTGSSGPYSNNFQQKLIDNGIYPDGYEYPDSRTLLEPDNLEEINEKLKQPRPSLSPSRFPNKRFREFKRADAQVSKENKATKTVIPIIEGEIADNKSVEGDVLFNNLTPLTNDELTAAKPDLYYGARPEQLNRRVRNELSGHIIPSTQDSLPLAPNFFLETKGPDGSLAVAGRQACYNGALGARGMHSLQSYGQDKPVYDNNAYTITSIYHGGQLKIYTSHPIKPTSPKSRSEYCMTQLKGYSMTSDPETFQKGACAYRNARDWAKEQREEAIKQANERAADSQPGTHTADTSFSRVFSFTAGTSLDEESQTSLDKVSNTNADSPESDTSTDELVLDHTIPAKHSKRHSKRKYQPRHNRYNDSKSGAPK